MPGRDASAMGPAAMCPARTNWRRIDLNKNLAIYDPGATAVSGTPFLTDDGSGIVVNGGLVGGVGQAWDTGVYAIFRLTDIIGQDWDAQQHGRLEFLIDVITAPTNEQTIAGVGVCNEADLAGATVDGLGVGVYHSTGGAVQACANSTLNGAPAVNVGTTGGATLVKVIGGMTMAGNRLDRSSSCGMTSANGRIASTQATATIADFNPSTTPYVFITLYRATGLAGTSSPKYNFYVAYTKYDSN